MKFKVNEHLPQDAAELLSTAGYDAQSIYDQNRVGESDSNIAKICQAEDRIIVTVDTDLGDTRMYPPLEYPRIIVLRLKQFDKPHVFNVMERMLAALSSQPLTHKLWIVDENRIRIRG